MEGEKFAFETLVHTVQGVFLASYSTVMFSTTGNNRKTSNE
jgi:hypothetical protein